MSARILQLPLAALALLAVASCNVQESTSPSEPTSVVLAPRLAAGKALPRAAFVTVRLVSDDGLVDTAQTIVYNGRQTINLGSLPPNVPFTITMSAFDTTPSGARVTSWWTSTRDTSGSSTTKQVWLPAPEQAAVPFATSDAFPATSYTVLEGDTVLFQGKPIKLPAGTRITTNGNDPRTDGSAKKVDVDTSYTTDSALVMNFAVKVDSNPTTGSPTLWSSVKTFRLMVDPLDTLTSLDTLFLTNWSSWKQSRDEDSIRGIHGDEGSTLNPKFIRPAQFATGSFFREDTIALGFDLNSLICTLFRSRHGQRFRSDHQSPHTHPSPIFHSPPTQLSM